jgi:hypothetical protein
MMNFDNKFLDSIFFWKNIGVKTIIDDMNIKLNRTNNSFGWKSNPNSMLINIGRAYKIEKN